MTKSGRRESVRLGHFLGERAARTQHHANRQNTAKERGETGAFRRGFACVVKPRYPMH